MKQIILSIFLVMAAIKLSANSPVGANNEPQQNTGGKILVAYFSWGGSTKQVAGNIAKETGATLFEIQTVKAYPTEYVPCTEVAKEERDNGIRPELKGTVENMDQYDIIFVGCPVWWHTAPMAIWTFLESEAYNFKGKTIIPFCTYGATYRDETLAKIVELTPDSKHLKGFGTTNKNENVNPWLKEIGVIK